MTILAWIYVVCLMLRVQIAEDAMWQLRVAYFRNFVNLKGLLTWDDVSNNIWSYLYVFLYWLGVCELGCTKSFCILLGLF